MSFNFRNLKPFILALIGNTLYALTVKLFLLPTGLVTGGTTGIALTMHYLFQIPVSMFVLIFNVFMLLIGLAAFGKTFAAATVASTFIYPVALECFDRLLGSLVLTDDILLCTIFTGLGIGISLGITIRGGASTGGMDIPPLLLHKLFGIPVSVSMYAFDIAILLSQAVFSSTQNLLYGIVLVMLYTLTLDKMLMMGDSRTEIRVVTEKSEELKNAILREIDRGVTMLDGHTGYLGNQTEVIVSVISNRELPRMEHLIHEIDPECFMVVCRVNEVQGRGFSMQKKYR